MRITWRAWGLGALVAAGLLLSSGALRANDAPVVHLKVVSTGSVTRLEAQANGSFEYSTYQPSGRLYVLDLSGVSAADPAGTRQLNSGLVKGYRVLSYSTGDKPNVRLEILLAPSAAVNVQRPNAQDVAIVVSPAAESGNLLQQNQVSLVPASDSSAPQDAAVGVGAIRQVNLSENNGTTQVSVSASGRLKYHSIRLHNPERLVLDFAGSRLRTSENHIASNLDPVRDIRMAQFRQDVSRIVIDLREPRVAYQITGNGNVVTVAFDSTAGAVGAASSSGSQHGNLMTTRAATPSPRLNHTAVALRGSTAVPSPIAILPVNLTQPAEALASPAGNAATLDSTAATPQAPSAATKQTKFTGEPISVNLKDVDLRDFFRLIHEISGLNVVVDPNVKGSLTIVLDDVPWDQALDIVLKNNDLDKQLEGNVLRVATKATLRKEAEETRDLAKAQAEAANVVTTTRVLSYAKATTLVGTLKKFLSSRGDIIADDRSNTLIIRDIPSTLPVIDNLIRELDRRSQQVEIEARVVEASRNFAREIGTQFGLAAGSPSRNNVIGGAAGSTPLTPPTPPPVVIGGTSSSGTSSIPAVTNMPAGTPTSGIAYGFTSTNLALDMIITAAENRGVGKLLSQPKVITQNNEKAVVKQGTKIPVQTIVNNTVSVQFVDAVLELDVTPQITADGTVYMDVTVENDQIDQAIPRVEGIPAIDTQSASTKVTVNDGATVVIGGIIVTSQRTAIEQVPLVGSIPVLGNLFKHTTVSSSSAELLFFLTPRILPS
jgi:type IV pilus secretin PilQ/predicted competence protein